MFTSLRSTLIWRGILALVVGLVAVGWPDVTVDAFVVLFAVHAFVAAGSDLATAFHADRSGATVGHVVLAVLSASAGVLALTWPGVTAVALTLLVACWALVTGVVQVALAFRHGNGAGERAMWTISGLISIALAIALTLRPDVGALSLATVFGLFSMIHGITMLTVAAQIRKLNITVSGLAVG